jgi:hypothetical protein
MKRKRKPSTSRVEYSVQYRRRGWVRSRRGRLFQSEWGVRRFVAQLRRPWRDLEPVVDLVVQRRVVGPWKHVDLAEPIDVDPTPRPLLFGPGSEW